MTSRDAALDLSELDSVNFSYLAAGEVPAGYAATPIPGAFVREGAPVPPLPVLISSVLLSVGYVDGEPDAEALLYSGVSFVDDDGRTWWGFASLSSFPYYGFFTADGGAESREGSAEGCDLCGAGAGEPCRTASCPALVTG